MKRLECLPEMADRQLGSLRVTGKMMEDIQRRAARLQVAKLPEIADRQLGGLRATGKMLGEIKLKAAAPQRRKIGWRPVLAFCAACVFCVGWMAWAMQNPEAGVLPPPLALDSQPAGALDPKGDGETTAGVRALLDLPAGGVSIGAGVEAPSYRSIFAEAQGGNFPMLLVEGRAYRMLKTPGQVSGSLLAESLGEVMEYTLEPALSNGGGIVSNAAGQGETVFAIAGMRGAMVATNVGGTLRAFQRVSFAGSAIVGGEGLADTLCNAGDVISLELSGVGAVSDSQTARQLMNVLLSNADYQGTSAPSGGSQSLLIGLGNGLTLQVMVSGDNIGACGTWSCPEFFEAFAQTIG